MQHATNSVFDRQFPAFACFRHQHGCKVSLLESIAFKRVNKGLSGRLTTIQQSLVQSAIARFEPLFPVNPAPDNYGRSAIGVSFFVAVRLICLSR